MAERFEVENNGANYGPTVVVRDEDGIVDRVYLEVYPTAFCGDQRDAHAEALAQVIAEHLPRLLREARRRVPVMVEEDRG